MNVFPIVVPPLRERKEDIPLLVDWFITKLSEKYGKRISSIPTEMMRELQNYSWPGNVRELENVIERYIVTNQIVLVNLTKGSALSHSFSGKKSTSDGSLADVETNYIINILEKTSWKIEGKNGAAALLGLHPSTLRARIRKYGIRRSTTT